MRPLELSFLNTFQVSLNQEPITHFRSSRVRGLLVYLALNGERPIAREALATLLWPEEPDSVARTNLRQTLYRLRQILGEEDSTTAPFLTITRQAVQLNPDSGAGIDVRDFLGAIERGELAAALELYRGDLLPGFTVESEPFEAWLRQTREDLHRLAIESLDELTREGLKLGQAEEAARWARHQLHLEPFRESAMIQLIRALAQAGERSEALRQFEAARQTLEAELGVAPSAEMVDLIDSIRSGAFDVSSLVAMTPPDKLLHNLPAETTALVGREGDIEQIVQLFVEENQRLVTLVGPGGMGKTHLALSVGRALLTHFRHGVYFVDLAPLTSAHEIPQAITGALNYQAPDQGNPVFGQLLQMLSHRSMLLILDNFEHLLDGVTVVTEILQGCPDVGILATSRQRLQLVSESRYDLSGLRFPLNLNPDNAADYTSMQLFVQSGRRVRPGFQLDQSNMADVARITQLVQGMPLGLVLAASWLELLSAAEIAAEIERNLDFLASDLADLPPRQQSMQAVFERTWEHLTDAERLVLAKLSVFRGGFTRDAAEQVAGANLRILLALINKSILARHAEIGRFSIHELLRQFAEQRYAELDPENKTAVEHCRYYADLVEKAFRESLNHLPLHLPEDHKWEWDNIRVAWMVGLHRQMVDELTRLGRGVVIFSMRLFDRPATLIQQAIRYLCENGFSEADHAILALRGLELVALGGIEQKTVVKEQLVKLVDALHASSRPELELRFWTYMHVIDYGIREDEVGVPWFDRADQIARDMEDPLFLDISRANRLWRQNVVKLVLSHLSEIKRLLAQFEAEYPLSTPTYAMLWTSAVLHAEHGEIDEALDLATRCLALGIRWKDLLWIDYAYIGLTWIYEKAGQTPEIHKLYYEDLKWHVAIGQSWQILGFLWHRIIEIGAVFNDPELVVAVISMAYHHPDAPPHLQQEISSNRSLPYLRTRFGEATTEAGWARGRSMGLSSAVELLMSRLKEYLISPQPAGSPV